MSYKKGLLLLHFVPSYEKEIMILKITKRDCELRMKHTQELKIVSKLQRIIINFGTEEETSFFFFLVDRNLFHFFHFPLFFFILIRTCGMFRDKTCHHVVSPGFFVSKEPEIVCWVIGYTGVSLPNNSRPGSVACEGGWLGVVPNRV